MVYGVQIDTTETMVFGVPLDTHKAWCLGVHAGGRQSCRGSSSGSSFSASMYNVDDHCQRLLLHTLCAMHTASLRERERLTSIVVVPGQPLMVQSSAPLFCFCKNK
jgi:hypothetical protein